MCGWPDMLKLPKITSTISSQCFKKKVSDEVDFLHELKVSGYPQKWRILKATFSWLTMFLFD